MTKSRALANDPWANRGSAFWAAVVALAALVVISTWIAAKWHGRATSASDVPTQAIAPEQRIARLAGMVDASMRASRPVLIGSRDPKGPSCVTVIKSGDLHSSRPNMMGDCNGGPGTTMAVLYSFDRQEIKSPQVDLNWHQARLKTWLENEVAVNIPAQELARELADASQQLLDDASNWTTVPDDLKSIGYQHKENWPGYCMTELDAAVARKDAAAVKQWAGELAQAALSLHDLHGWLDLLCHNHLQALEFQLKCASLFEETDAAMTGKYVPDKAISAFPAGVLSLNGWSNYFEIERQGERLFSIPPDRIEEISTNAHLTPASLWVSPAARACFLKLQSSLSPANQETFAKAARTPFEHSYLVNMLYHAWNADVADDMTHALRKFDASHPKATVGELMSVLMYRGHAFGGLEWSDRFAPELRTAADAISAELADPDAFASAVKWTNSFFRQSQYAPTFTLRDALDQKKLDCVRATDMIGAVYRNAGRPRFGNVRISAGTFAHSVAAYLGRSTDEKPRTVVADALDQSQQTHDWPQFYFQNYAWPSEFNEPSKPYCAELYIRGLDNYVWLEGYIIRGPNAGTLMTTRLPYSTHPRPEATTRAFGGPFAQ